MNKFIEINAYYNDGTQRVPFYLLISEPCKTENDDFYCKVSLPMLFTKEKLIYGINELQAKELAIEFVKQMIDVSCILDQDGKSIDFSVN